VFRLLHLLVTGVALAGVLLTVPRRGAAPVAGRSVPVLWVAAAGLTGEAAARRAVADAATAHGPSSAEYARAVDGLIVALCASGHGALDETLLLAEGAVERRRQQVPFAADLASDAQVRLGQVLTERGAYARAAQVLGDAVSRAKRGSRSARPTSSRGPTCAQPTSLRAECGSCAAVARILVTSR
jgi:hypothetical protein